jgi:hypothetical protein
MIRALSISAMAVALVALQLTAQPAWAKKHHYHHAAQQQGPEASATPWFSSKDCPGGVSRGCGPGSCRCP